MQHAEAAKPDAVFRSFSQLEQAGHQPWAWIGAAAAAWGLAFWHVEIALAIGFAFALWMLTEAWRATGPIAVNSQGPFTSYADLQPPSKWAFGPSLGSCGAVLLLALLPWWKIQAIAILGGLLASWVVADAIVGFSRSSPSPGPPFKTFSALSRSESRPGGLLLSAGAHVALCFLPLLVFMLAAWLAPPEPERKPPHGPVLVLKLRPREPVQEKKKVVTPRTARNSVPKAPEEHSKPIDVGKLDLSRMAVEFDADRDQILPSVLAEYGARIAFVDSADSDAYLHGRTPGLLSDYVYSAVDWSRFGREGVPQDISTEYLLVLQDPDKCLAIARLQSALGSAGSDLQVWLLFPRIVKGFEQQLASAIASQAQKQAAELQGSIISRVRLAFSTEAPGISVRHVDAVAAMAPVAK